ncbi:MAG: PadR family transcriptional regulator, partial [Kosmotogaceae bacterium]
MIRGHLKVMVLKGLSEKRMTGYSLMKYIDEKIGVKPSPGSMYPLLKDLEKEDLIRSKKIDNKKE